MASVTETNDSTAPEPNTPPSTPIAAGHARQAVLVAIANVAHAVAELEATAVAVARALDATAGPS